MTLLFDLKLLALIGIANGAPICAQKLFGRRFSYPLDGHSLFRDGRPFFGGAKSIRGIVLAVIATTIAAPCLGLEWRLGASTAALAMVGDLCSSFIKRRLGYPTSSMALGLDQLPESLFPVLGARVFVPLSLGDMAAIITAFFVGEIVLSRALYKMRLRDRPY